MISSMISQMQMIQSEDAPRESSTHSRMEVWFSYGQNSFISWNLNTIWDTYIAVIDSIYDLIHTFQAIILPLDKESGNAKDKYCDENDLHIGKKLHN